MKAVRLNAHYTKNQPDPEKLREASEDDALSAYFRDIEPLSPVNKEIVRCILSEDEIADDASAGLLDDGPAGC